MSMHMQAFRSSRAGSMRRARLAVVSTLAAGGLLFAVAQPASADLVDRSHQDIVLTIPNDNICGVPVTTTIDQVNNFQLRLSSSGFPLFQNAGQGTVTWMNPANGKSISDSFTGNTKDLTAVDNGDGTFTVRTALTGTQEKLATGNGKAISVDVGRVVFSTVVDYNGTPADPSDDINVHQTVESVSGPHPDLQSDGALFCQVVIAALN